MTVATPLPPVRGHASRLQHVLVNLLANAAKFIAPDGAVALVAEGARRELIIGVRDDGVGIARDLLHSIFEPICHGPAPRHHPGGGLWIGLTVVRPLVEMHGGAAAAHSDGSGAGAEFTVRLPVRRARAA